MKAGARSGLLSEIRKGPTGPNHSNGHRRLSSPLLYPVCPDSIFVNPEYEEELTDFDEPMYLYFSFTDRKVINGIEFLS